MAILVRTNATRHAVVSLVASLLLAHVSGAESEVPAAPAESPRIVTPLPDADRTLSLPRASPAVPVCLMTLAELEQIALQNNPTLRQARDNVQEARGYACQAGLCPNPQVGYNTFKIGDMGSAGYHGAFVVQEVITAGKLRLMRARFQQEVARMEAVELAQQLRVLNGVRMFYWRLLAQRRLIDVEAALLRFAEDALVSIEQMANVGQANRPDLLQARVQRDRQQAQLQNAQVQYDAAWRQLGALIGQPDLPVCPLAGAIDLAPPVPSYPEALELLLANSPEVMHAGATIRRSELSLKRERVEPIPNVLLRAGTEYSFETNRQVAEAQLQIRIPLFDRNQGNIRTAQAEVARAREELTRVQLSLEQRLAQVWANYRSALNAVELYQRENLPAAQQSFELYAESWRGQRRASYAQVLIAQRVYYQIARQYVEALLLARQAEVAICGLLLVDGLDQPLQPPPQHQEGDLFRHREKDSGPTQLRDPNAPDGRKIDDRFENLPLRGPPG